MAQATVSRRAWLIGAGAVAGWAASPARALLRDADPAALLPALEALLARMTPAEKAGQLTLMAATWVRAAGAAANPAAGQATNFEAQLADARAGRLTGVFNGAGAEGARRLQRAAIDGSRLKIPLLFAADIIHGARTVFPIPLAEAASFDPELARATARVAATEAAAMGIDWTFAPMVDIGRDQRWGRVMEGAGEDVYLGRLLAAARVHGFQGERGLAADDAVMACAKHFAAYGAAEAGLDYSTVDVSERTLREVYFPPFQAAFDAGALSVMASFNELAGVPATGNRWLLTDVLRGEWRFPGIVVSDYTGDAELVAHGVAADARAAAKLAFLAGCDMSMQSRLYLDHLPALVAAGEVPLARLDEAVRRVLFVKHRLGLFDDPFRRIDLRRERARNRTPGALRLARVAGRRAIVLLRNERDLLPLPKAGRRIALIGPFAQGPHDLNGPWSVYGDDAEAVDLATGVRGAVRDPASVTVTAGCGVEAPLPGGIAAAVAAARAADVVLLAIGESEEMSGEAQSRAAIVVPAAQQALAEAVAATGTPLVVVLKNGRALALEGAVRDAPAILVTWFLGSESGNAIADMLFGDEGPSARLPVSFPQATGQEPYHYDHKPSGRPGSGRLPGRYKTNFREFANVAAFPFGHGLTYGRVGYSAPAPGTTTMAWDDRLELRAMLTNSGARTAEEVVQLYVRDAAASVTRPVRQLCGFRRVRLAPGATVAVVFTLTRADLAFVGIDNRSVAEPGDFRWWIAPDAAADGVSGMFTLLAP